MYTIIITEDNLYLGERADKALSMLVPHLSRMQIQKAATEGRITLGDAPFSTLSYKIKPGDVFVIQEAPLYVSELTPVPMDLDIIYEDEAILVLNKPAGLVVHPGAGQTEHTLVHGLLAHVPEGLSDRGGEGKPGIVHRLDKDTSGLMVVAKTNEAHVFLASQFENRTLSRTYIAFVLGCPLPYEGTIRGNIGRDPKNRQKMALLRTQAGKPAVTHYHVLEAYIPAKGSEMWASKVECHWETGRTHQIRVHMAAKGHPVLGDPTYGNAANNPVMRRLLSDVPESAWTNTRQALHAYKLKLIHPVSQKEMRFEAPIPKDLEALEDLLINYL